MRYKVMYHIMFDPFVDDAGIKGPPSTYNDEPIKGNPAIRRFVYEYATTLDHILARFIAAGITASGLKNYACYA